MDRSDNAPPNPTGKDASTASLSATDGARPVQEVPHATPPNAAGEEEAMVDDAAEAGRR